MEIKTIAYVCLAIILSPIAGGLLAGIDWTQMVGGLAVAVLFVWLASEYRRRYIIT